MTKSSSIGAARRKIEAAGRAPVLGWIGKRIVPVCLRGADVAQTIKEVRAIMEGRNGTSQGSA